MVQKIFLRNRWGKGISYERNSRRIVFHGIGSTRSSHIRPNSASKGVNLKMKDFWKVHCLTF